MKGKKSVLERIPWLGNSAPAGRIFGLCQRVGRIYRSRNNPLRLPLAPALIMAKKDKRVDAYIAESADFAKPILQHLRALVHRACPEVEETIKWRFPCFMHQGMLCSMAAFKQ